MTATEQASNGNLPDGTVAVVVVAAGLGERLGAGVPKAFVELGGQNLLELSEAIALSLEHPIWLVRVVPNNYTGERERSWENGEVVGQAVVAGGSTRQESVAAGLAVIPTGIDHVLIHDAARALTPSDVFARVLAALEAGAQAVVPALPVTDTIKQVELQGDREVVVDTPDRASLRAIQTPQGFKLETLRDLHANAVNADATDDAGLAEQAGVVVEVVEGSPDAFKVTTPQDLKYARYVLSTRGQTS